jgi:malonyl-ACP decarboxylase
MPDGANTAPPVVAGIGLATPFGYGKDALRNGLFAPRPVFDILRRPGRQLPERPETQVLSPFMGAEMSEPPDLLPPRESRTASLAGRVAIAVLDEAWRDAGLDALDPKRIGLVVGGANLQAREQMLTQQAYAERMPWLRPHHGHTFFDTDLCGLCASHLPIRGFAMTVGGASASGALAVLHAVDTVRSGRVDACIALAALQDLSYFELQGMRALGALSAGAACRPFDRSHDGFLYAEASAAIVVCRAELCPHPYGRVLGGAHIVDGNRGPNPSPEGELRAIRGALAHAGLAPDEIDYVNTHGTGTPLGDITELGALRAADLQHARINATKSLLGHGLAAAGAVEVAAVLLQMQAGRLHPTLHLDDPVDPSLPWVAGRPEAHCIRHALKLSFGFGGFDTALVLGAPDSIRPIPPV